MLKTNSKLNEYGTRKTWTRERSDMFKTIEQDSMDPSFVERLRESDFVVQMNLRSVG